jgi:hypothetical protein
VITSPGHTTYVFLEIGALVEGQAVCLQMCGSVPLSLLDVSPRIKCDNVRFGTLG